MEPRPVEPLQPPPGKADQPPTPLSPSSQTFRTTKSHSRSIPPYSPTYDHSPSAQARHLLTRPLSPDLPTRDVLYLFCNFSSYMRSPQEGAEGIRDNTDFHDTIRLLDFARTIATNPHSNVRILHLKYRFQTPDQGMTEVRQEKLSAKDDRGRRNVTVPQPFSTLHDPVIKVDYQDNGIFQPLPAQAVFQHISKACQPPPRIIVVSYVGAKATENHISSLAAWAHTSTPSIYVFSPLETRLRERRPLSDALHHGIPISMYSSPSSVLPLPGFSTIGQSSPKSMNQSKPHRTRSHDETLTSPPPSSPQRRSPSMARRASVDSRPLPPPYIGNGGDYNPRTYPPDPVATLSILTPTDRARGVSPTDGSGDRVPLWMLAPGAAILHGSTSASLGVKLSDFSAINLIKGSEKDIKGMSTSTFTSSQSQSQSQMAKQRTFGLTMSSMHQRARKEREGPTILLPPLDALARRGTAATSEPISRTSSAASIRIVKGSHHAKEADSSTRHPMAAAGNTVDLPEEMCNLHLTPPKQDPRRLSPPEQKPAPSPLPLSQLSWPRTRSWPTTREKVPGWKRGRRDVMEDAMDEVGPESGEVKEKGGVPGQDHDPILAALQNLTADSIV